MPVLERGRPRDSEDMEDDDEDEDLEVDESRAGSPAGRHSSGQIRSRPGSQWGQTSRPGSGVRPTSGRPGSRIGSATRSRSLPRPPSSRSGYGLVSDIKAAKSLMPT